MAEDAAPHTASAPPLKPSSSTSKSRQTKNSLAAIVLGFAYALAMFHRAGFGEIAAIGGSGISAASVSLFTWEFFLVYFFSQIPVGVLVDVAGARRVAIIGSAAMSLGSLAFAVSLDPWILGASRALCALGAVGVFLALLSYCSKNFGTHGSSATGRAMSIGNLGGVAAGIPLVLLLELTTVSTIWFGLSAVAALTCVALANLMEKEPQPESIRQALRHSVPSFLRQCHHSDVYLAAGALAGMAGAFHAFSAYGVHRLASSFDLDARTDGLLISVMVIGFAQGSWAWGKLGDESAVRNKIARGAPLVALGFWCLLVVAPPSNPLALGLVLLAVGFMTSSFSVIYLMLTELAAPDARSAVKAAANCGIALGACVAQLAISHLPDALSAAPSAALGVVGVLCCLALANRCHSEATAATLDETESEADAPGAAPADA